MGNLINPLSANFTEWSDTLKQLIRRQQPTNCLSKLDHFVGLALKGLNVEQANGHPFTLIYNCLQISLYFTYKNTTDIE